jgi:hypothetical protein
MFGRRSRIVFIRLRCLCLSYTLLRLQCYFRSCFRVLRSWFMSLKNYSVMPAPVLGVRIRIVAMRILLLASYINWRSGSSAYGSGSIREQYTMTIAPAPAVLIQYRLSFMRLQCGSIDAVRVRIPALLLYLHTIVQ